mmetsp:Transcript_27797/g.37134  ORF Transcript_27797/g.37134 Transcript_27797/m.37134 type:complete len:426 (-) Transcript_27797:2516-3793(-)
MQQKMKEMNETSTNSVMPFFIMTLKVPKIFLKKLIGYQEKMLLQLKKDNEVNFVYDERLVTDVIYCLDDTSVFRIYGKGRDVVKVSSTLQAELDKLQIRTLAVTKEESKFIFDNIKEVKSQIDPCEIRVKRHVKDKAEIKHPFFFSLNQSRDVCLIGTSSEIERAEQRLYEFYAYRLDKPDLSRTSLCFLLPAHLSKEIYEIKQQLSKQVPDIFPQHFAPQRPRRHITVYLTGSWKSLILAKHVLAQITNERIRRIPSLCCQNFQEFQEFTFNQQLRSNFKILKRIVLEESWVFLKFWDTTSEDLRALAYEYDASAPQPPDTLTMPYRGGAGLSSDPLQTPFLKEAFIELQDKAHVSQSELLRYGQAFMVRYNKSMRYRHLHYLKALDNETALNALFVLSEENQNLPKICQRLSIDKTLFVYMAC